MMERFFSKYAKSLEYIALKSIDKDVDKAKDLCEENHPDYIKYLVSAHHKIEDYLREKGINPDL